MPNLPISTHLTVVSVTPAADAASPLPGAARPGSDQDFSSLLARQLAAKPELPVPGGDTAAEPAATATDAAVPADPANGLAVIAFVPVAPPAAAIAAGPSADAPRAGAERTTGLARALAVADGHAAIQARQALPEGEPTAAGAAANLAAPDVRVSAKAQAHPVAEALAPAVQHAAKLTQADTSAAGLPEAAPAAMPHAVMAARSDGVAPSAAAPAATVAVESRVASPGWGAELGQKVVWLASQQQQVAHINVTPPQLGPIEIRLNLAHDQASATFVSPHAAVRDAIEAALPRLREMLAESGLTLGNVDVSAHSFGHARQDQARGEPTARGFVPEAASAVGALSGAALGSRAAGLRGGEGLVDIFA